MMTNENRNTLRLLGELLVQIRGIAGDALNLGHVSALGHGQFTQESACRAIYALADAAHNLPICIADGPEGGAGFLMSGSLKQTKAVGVEVFGAGSTLGKW